jgi:hypothetical protein
LVTNPSFSTLPSSSWFVATVVPCETAAIRPPPTRPSTFSMPAMNPSAGLPGVDGVLVVTSSPVASSNATTSVNVPPVSMPIRIVRASAMPSIQAVRRRRGHGRMCQTGAPLVMTPARWSGSERRWFLSLSKGERVSRPPRSPVLAQASGARSL